MSAKNVGAVAALAGVSVRTLHHYDHVGLVVPTSARCSTKRADVLEHLSQTAPAAARTGRPATAHHQGGGGTERTPQRHPADPAVSFALANIDPKLLTGSIANI